MRLLSKTASAVFSAARISVAVSCLCILLFAATVRAQGTMALETGTAGEKKILSEQDFLKVIAEENESVRRQVLETLIAKEGIQNAWGLFEPTLEMSYERDYENEQNDADQAAIRNYDETYTRHENVGSLGINSLLPTGTNVELIHELHDPYTSLQNDEQYGRQKEIKLGVAVTQPLLKNFGTDVNLTKVRIAEMEHKISEYRLDRARLIAVYRAGQSYYDMMLAQIRYDIEGQQLELAKELASIVNKQVDEGRVPTSAIFRSESSLARRKSRFHSSERLLRGSASSIRKMLVGTSMAAFGEIRVDEKLPDLELVRFADQIDYPEVLKFRPDYLAAELEHKLEKDRVEYADNQCWWDVNLEGEYGQTGMGRNWGDAYSKLGEGYEYWTVGANVKVPLGGGVSEESMLKAAKKRAERAQLSLSTLDGVIRDELSTSRKEALSAHKEALGLFKVVGFQRKVLDDGRKLFKQGRIARSELIVQEQEYLESQLILVEKMMEFKKAMLTFWLAQGRLLEACNIPQGG